MTRFVQCLAFAAAVAGGAVVLSEPARANPTCQAGLTCPVEELDPGKPHGQPSRIVRRKRLVQQTLVAEARVLDPEPSVIGPSRYVGLLILGVGY